MEWTWKRLPHCAGVITAPDGREIFLQGDDCALMDDNLRMIGDNEESKQHLLSTYSCLLEN